MFVTLNDHNPKRAKKEFNGNHLYTACRDVQNEENGVVFRRVSGKLELVAFWCAWDKKVKAGFQATEMEKSQIWNFHITANFPQGNGK